MSLYRSGLMLDPPLALHGHSFVQAERAREALGDLYPARPAFWRCVRCHVIRTTADMPDHPCPDLARALGAGS